VCDDGGRFGGVDVAVGVWEPSGMEVTVNEGEDSVL